LQVIVGVKQEILNLDITMNDALMMHLVLDDILAMLTEFKTEDDVAEVLPSLILLERLRLFTNLDFHDLAVLT
jgi:hypothetical protein